MSYNLHDTQTRTYFTLLTSPIPVPKKPYFVPRAVADERFYPTWDDPAKYTGETVETWPPGKDRNMTAYLTPETAIDSPCSEAEFAERGGSGNTPAGVRLLVAIKSGPLKFEERMTNR